MLHTGEEAAPLPTGEAEEQGTIESPRQGEDTVPVGTRSGVTGETATEGSELEKAQGQIALLKEQLLRKAAEFENYRRRTIEERNALVAFATEGLMRDLLPILDDFDRSIANAKQQPDFDSFYAAMELVRSKLLRVLEQRGLKPFDSAGKPFDIEFHDAVMRVPSPDIEPG
ncbi:MAG: nucleotide exchange factor GrpE, partial [Bacteroidota bacterium]|nr:nucleotide exchange factor GrpE [Bacteroidota bacterium]